MLEKLKLRGGSARAVGSAIDNRYGGAIGQVALAPLAHILAQPGRQGSAVLSQGEFRIFFENLDY